MTKKNDYNLPQGVTHVDEVRADQASFWTPWSIAWAALLFAWLVLLYQPSFRGPYHFDDLGNVINNPATDTFPPQVAWHRAESRPLVMATFSLERALWGKWPAAHRIGNVVIHVSAASILALLIHQVLLLTQPPCRVLCNSSHYAIVAVVVATLWAVHPLNTQAIAYIVQRCESLMGLFYFAFLLAIVRHEQTRAWGWLVAGAGCFYLGLASKTVMVTGLAVGPLMDRAWLCASWREVFRKRAWLYLPPIIAGLVAVTTLLPGILRGDSNVGFGGDAPPVLSYMAGEAEVIVRYFVLAIAPIRQNFDYDFNPPQPWQTNLGWIVAVTMVIVAAAWMFVFGSKLTRHHQRLAFFILAPLLVLSPTSSFIPTADLMVEHRMYVPLAMILCGIAAPLMLNSIQSSAQDKAVHGRVSNALALNPRRGPLAIGGFAVAFALLSFATWNRVHVYESGVRLWYTTLLENPDNARAAQNLTNAAIEESQTDELLPLFATALKHAQQTDQPTSVILGRIGEELVKRGAAKAAIAPLEQAIATDPSPTELADRFYSPSRRFEFASHRINLGIALSSLNRPEAAIEQLTLAFTINDQSADARAIAGDLLYRMGRADESMRHFERALELRPGWREVTQQLDQIRAATSPVAKAG